MKPIDILLIAIIAAWFIIALRRILKTKKNGGCMGCGGGCSCHTPKEASEENTCECCKSKSG